MKRDTSKYDDPRVQALPAFSQTLEQQFPQRDFSPLSPSERAELEEMIRDMAYTHWLRDNPTPAKIEQDRLEALRTQQLVMEQESELSRQLQEGWVDTRPWLYRECAVQLPT